MILNPSQAFILLEKKFPRLKTAIACIIFVMSHHIWDEGWDDLWPFLAQGVFFMQNKCLQWIRNHEKPLV